MPPPCKFYASGNCRKGNKCNFSHADQNTGGFGNAGFGKSGFLNNNSFLNNTGFNKGFGGAFSQNTPKAAPSALLDFTNTSTVSQKASQIKTDLEEYALFYAKPLLSTYGLGYPAVNSLISGRDISPEELRMQYLEAVAANTVPQYENMVRARARDMKFCIDHIKGKEDLAARYLMRSAEPGTNLPKPFVPKSAEENVEQFMKEPSPANTAFGASGFGSGGAFGSQNTAPNPFGSTNAFGSSSNAFGSAANNTATGNSAFGNAAPASGLAFGSSGFGSTPSNLGFGSSGFGNTSASGFGSSAPASGTSSGFGSSGFGSLKPSGASAFGSSGFGASGTSSATSAFGSSGFGSSGFGSKPAASPFGSSGLASAKPSASPFGAVATNNASPFGENTAPAATTTSPFGQTSASSAFTSTAPPALGQPAAPNSNPFGASSLSVFGQPAAQTGQNASGFASTNPQPGAFGTNNISNGAVSQPNNAWSTFGGFDSQNANIQSSKEPDNALLADFDEAVADAFNSAGFTLGNVPDIAPPAAIC